VGFLCLGQRRGTARAALALTVAGLLGASLIGNPSAWGEKSPPTKAIGAKGWHRKAVPFPADWQSTLAPDTLTSVSCASARSCMAVGEYHNDFVYAPLIEHWNGSHWDPMSAPAPATTRPFHDYYLERVSCPAANWCLAVGNFTVYGSPSTRFPNGVRSYPYAAVYDGVGWEALSTDALKLNDGTGYLDAISCPKVERCDAVASTDSKKHRGGFLRFDGNGWSRLGPVPRTSGVTANLVDLSCANLGHCRATPDGAKVATWNGQRWSVKRVGKGKNLDDIDCPTAKDCVAVGGTTTGPVGTSTHSELWARGIWHTMPKSRDHAKGLDQVSCPTTRSCYTVGGYYRPYVARWNAASGKWAVARPKIPSHYYAVRMTALDCPTTKFCMGVGELDPNSVSRHDGLTSWTLGG
jgi:hypothetical protein